LCSIGAVPEWLPPFLIGVLLGANLGLAIATMLEATRDRPHK
jgi:hypothetical protein